MQASFLITCDMHHAELDLKAKEIPPSSDDCWKPAPDHDVEPREQGDLSPSSNFSSRPISWVSSDPQLPFLCMWASETHP